MNKEELLKKIQNGITVKDLVKQTDKERHQIDYLRQKYSKYITEETTGNTKTLKLSQQGENFLYQRNLEQRITDLEAEVSQLREQLNNQ